jgi:4-hydroxy-tetrahydrodipicolinate reductase
MQKKPVALAGAAGRMGQVIIEALAQSDDLILAAALCRPGDARLGQPCSPGHDVPFSDDIAAALKNAAVLIDFSSPAASLQNLVACVAEQVPSVIGTTGFKDIDRATIEEASTCIGVVLAPNMSVGVNLTLALLGLAARALPADYDVEILEMHHRNKVDAPSGTALKMGDVIAKARGTTLAELRLPVHDGHTGVRPSGKIGFAALRGGDVVGEHTVMFQGIGERIEISHRSTSRQSYADGSLLAARFLLAQPAGLYDMQDVLGLAAD